MTEINLSWGEIMGNKSWGTTNFLTGTTKNVIARIAVQTAALASLVLVASVGNAAISGISATNDASNALYKYTYSGTPTYLRIYLDTDKNASTGFSYNGIGANFLIENGSLYRYSGTNGAWGWTSVASSGFVRTSTLASWSVPLASLGSPSSLNLIANTSAGDISGIVAQSISSATAPVVWTKCADEGGTCSFSGTRQIRYGSGSTWVVNTFTSSVSCSNAVFGDPLVGQVKECQYSSVSSGGSSPTPTPASSPTPTPAPTATPIASGSVSTVNYTASSANIINPERGFFNQLNCNGSFSVSQLQGYRSGGNSLIRCYFNLGAFVNSDISASTLTVLETLLNNMRTAGVKTVMRFNYNNSDTGIDAPLTQLSRHLDQLKPIMEKHKDVLAVVEAGLIGSWGEGDNSINYGKSWQLTSQNWADRKTVALKQLASVPVERFVSFHMPREKMTFDGAAPLTSSEAYSGTNKARHGHHNDCFLSTPTDWGTYTNVSVEYPYLAADSAFTPVGGETCKVNQPRSDCDTALKEMGMFHWSYLNIGYNTSVLDTWRTQGCFAEVQKRLGYRFVLQNGSYSTTAKPGGAMAVKFTVVNQGFAAPFNSRAVELVLRNNSSGAIYRMPLNTDPRFWQPGAAVTVSQNVVLPSGMASGNYAAFLNLPDPMAAIRNRPEYSIQLANTNMWEASTGMNNLNHVVTVSP